MLIITINPATEEKLAEYPEFTREEIDSKITASKKAWRDWKKTSFATRSELMNKTADSLEQNAEKYARLMALEMGKPIAQGVAESKKCAWVCRYYAENAEKQIADYNIGTEYSKSFVSYRPIGVVLAIMPWNFPFWQVFRFAAPALMAGNAGILKHSSNTTGCGLEIERIFAEAGFPENLFGTLSVTSRPMRDVIKHPDIAAVTLTGSAPVGRKVASTAGNSLKKTVLELGGGDPYVVLADADLDKTVETCVTGRLINSGQSCIAAKRFIVEESIVDEFSERFVAIMSEKSMGDPLDPKTDVGPQARGDLRDDLIRQAKESVDLGANLALGGLIPEGLGFYYPPTVLTNVGKGMPVYEEETFGPIAAIISAKNETEAIQIANDTEFGLGAAIFTEDVEKGERIAREELDAGCVFVNDFVKSDPRLPFGGVKNSGYGRELSEFGIKEFLNIKTVVVK